MFLFVTIRATGRAALIGEMIKARENAGDPGGLNVS